jgi:Zn-dependent protease
MPMGDPFTWAVPLGRFFGITVKVHILFPVVAVALILRAAFHTVNDKPIPAGTVNDAALLMGLLFLSVLLHEFGHCAGARLVDGDATEILLWPLGGLAALEIPHRPRAHFIAVAMGPGTNLALCLMSGFFLVWLTGFEARPPLDPINWYPYRTEANLVDLCTWAGEPINHPWPWGVVILARLFWINWVLFLLNVVLIGFPLDGGRLFQCALWPWYGFRQATLAAIYAGFITMLIVGVYSVVREQVLALCLALFIYFTCRQQWILLQMGSEESLFGYDFSQGYTSLEGEVPTPRRRRPNFLQRWLQRRAARKQQREQEMREAEERRMDELLEKIQREGKSALTDEEQRFLKRVSDRKRIERGGP